MRRVWFTLLLICGIAGAAFAQDLFRNVNNFRYDIEFSSEYGDSTNVLTEAYLSVRYSVKDRVTSYTLHIDRDVEYKGKVLDININKQALILLVDGYFPDSKVAKMIMTQSPDVNNMKVALICYANPKDDPSKTCHCYILKDVEEKAKK